MDNALIERPRESSVPSPRESRIRVESLEEADVYAVLFPAETAAGTEAKAYWQHTGELVSSRRAENALKKLGQTFSKRVTCCPIEGTTTILHPYDTLQKRLLPDNCFAMSFAFVFLFCLFLSFSDHYNPLFFSFVQDKQ